MFPKTPGPSWLWSAAWGRGFSILSCTVFESWNGCKPCLPCHGAPCVLTAAYGTPQWGKQPPPHGCFGKWTYTSQHRESCDMFTLLHRFISSTNLLSGFGFHWQVQRNVDSQFHSVFFMSVLLLIHHHLEAELCIVSSYIQIHYLGLSPMEIL